MPGIAAKYIMIVTSGPYPKYNQMEIKASIVRSDSGDFVAEEAVIGFGDNIEQIRAVAAILVAKILSNPHFVASLSAARKNSWNALPVDRPQ
jgi:hypothetical protein